MVKRKGTDGSAAAPKMTSEERAAARRARFEKLAPKRVTKALQALAHVANLGNRLTYSYTNEEAHKIQVALKEALAAVVSAFDPDTKSNGKPTFTL